MVAEFDSVPALYTKPDSLLRVFCDAAKVTVACEKGLSIAAI